MFIRIDPVPRSAAPRVWPVEPVRSRREEPSEEREERREEEPAASYAAAPEPVVDAYAPPADVVARPPAPLEPRSLMPALVALAAPPAAAPSPAATVPAAVAVALPVPAGSDPLRLGTPAWMTSLLKAR